MIFTKVQYNKFMSRPDNSIEDNDPLVLEITELLNIINKLQTQNSKLKECVEFYANKDNWYINDADGFKMIIASRDTEGSEWVGGKRARQCLKELEQEPFALMYVGAILDKRQVLRLAVKRVELVKWKSSL